MKKQLLKKLYALVVLVMLTSAYSKAQIDTALASQLQNVLNKAVATGGNHGVSAHLILQNGQTWSGTAGVNGQSQPLTDSTVFITASISKLNIAIVLLSFQQDGLISLDDTWHKYLPTLNVAFDTNITIRQLLNHTSGITDYLEVPANGHYVTSNFSTFYTPKYIMENIVSGVPDFAAGTNFNYSNSNYCLAAMVAEAATSNSLAYELRTRVWNPAGMKHTYFGAYEPILDQRAGVWWNFGNGLTNYSSQSDTSMLSFGYGTDNVVTCPTDLAKLVHALLNNQLLNANSMTQMLTWVPQSFVNQWVAGYGLGIHHQLGQTVDTLLGHDGKFCNLSDVFHSNMCGFTLATMTNTETLWEGIYDPMYDILRKYFGCNAVPVANFYTGVRVACTGAPITFIESSTNMPPTAWHWSFPGGTLTGGTTVNDSIPQVTYNAPGTYAVSYTASTSAGSNSITKNSYITINSNVPTYNSTFVESFETATLPNSDWSINSTKGLNWDVTSIGAATGSKSVYIDNFSNPAGNVSSLVSTTFDLSGFSSPKLTFKMAYQQKVSSNVDKLQVLTTTDCEGIWASRWVKSGSALATVTPTSPVPLFPTPGQFTTYTVNINAVAGSSNVRFKFDFFADPTAPGNYIFIDDINVFDALAGIQTNESQIMDLNVYPNPSNSKFTVETNALTKQTLNLFDVNGKLVLSQTINGKTNIDVSNLAEGVYNLSLINQNGVVNKRLVILR